MTKFSILKKIQKDPTTKEKPRDFPAVPKDKRMRSSSPTSQQSRIPPHENKKTTQFELKDNLPVAGKTNLFSSPKQVVRNIHTTYNKST